MGLSTKHSNNGAYSSFHLKARLWVQNNKNLHIFGVTTDNIVVTET